MLLKEKSRFAIHLEDGESVIEYHLKDGIIDFYRTYVPPEHRGKGYAQKLAKEAIQYAEDNGFSIQATCSFVEKYLQRHKL